MAMSAARRRPTAPGRAHLHYGIVTLLVLCAVLSGDRSRAKSIEALKVSEIENPAGRNSLSPAVSTGPKGEFVLSWLESSGTKNAFRFATGNGRGWGITHTVVTRTNFDTYPEAPPVVQPLRSGVLLAVWAEKKEGGGKIGELPAFSGIQR